VEDFLPIPPRGGPNLVESLPPGRLGRGLRPIRRSAGHGQPLSPGPAGTRAPAGFVEEQEPERIVRILHFLVDFRIRGFRRLAVVFQGVLVEGIEARDPRQRLAGPQESLLFSREEDSPGVAAGAPFLPVEAAALDHQSAAFPCEPNQPLAVPHGGFHACVGALVDPDVPAREVDCPPADVIGVEKGLRLGIERRGRAG